MSLWNFIKSIPSVLGTAATIGYSISKIALPILKGMRDMIPEVGKALGFVEGKVAEGGIVADDWLDKNITTIDKVGQSAGRGASVLIQLQNVCEKLRFVSQEQTPDTVDPQEVEMLAAEFKDLYERATSMGPDLDETVLLLEQLEE